MTDVTADINSFCDNCDTELETEWVNRLQMLRVVPCTNCLVDAGFDSVYSVIGARISTEALRREAEANGLDLEPNQRGTVDDLGGCLLLQDPWRDGWSYVCTFSRLYDAALQEPVTVVYENAPGWKTDKIRAALEPLGLWDPGRFGLWIVPILSEKCETRHTNNEDCDTYSLNNEVLRLRKYAKERDKFEEKAKDWEQTARDAGATIDRLREELGRWS